MKKSFPNHYQGSSSMLNKQKGLVALIMIFSVSVFAKSQTFEVAQEFFKQGKFFEAERALPKESEDYEVLVLKGHLALLANKLMNAKKYLQKATKLKPSEKLPQQLLAELFYRTNDFQTSAKFFQVTGRGTVAKKLASFATKQPYQIEGKVELTKIKFIKTDPLPIVTAKINGGEELNFIIDTGGAELIVDTDFVAANNITQFGAESGTFGGGQKSNFQHGKIDSFTLSDLTIKNVPINILKTQRFGAALGVKRVDGIIGSILLFRFISTIDYKNEQLILRKNTKANLKKLGKAIEIPFWMAGDHYLVAWGSVNKSSQLFFIDTGLAGMGFTCPESTLKTANIKLENQSTEGVRGRRKYEINAAYG